MKKYLAMMAVILLSSFSFAAAPAETAATAKPAKKNSQTDMNFEDLLVSGQYHFSDEAVTTVEEDKVLNSLIGVRTDFKDRMKQSSTLGEVKK